jgi:uncharacterized damage-inducible protein DinB
VSTKPLRTKTKSSRTKPAAKAKASAVKPAAKAAAKPATLKPAAKAAKPAAKPARKPVAAATPAFSTEPQQRTLANVKQFFDRSTACLDEGDAAFAPAAGMFSAAQQVAHVAQTTDWFREGAFNPKGFHMDFEAMEGEVRKVTSLAAARKWHAEAHERLMKALKEKPAAEWLAAIPQDTIMGGAPRIAIIDGLADHTAHHRGALTAYARLRGKTPAMPYM